MVDWVYNGLIEWLAERVQGMLAGLAGLLTATLFTSPDVTVFPQTQALAERSVVVVNAAFVLAIVAAGAMVMVHGTLQVQYQAKDLLPRLVAAWVLANTGVPLCRTLIEVANAVTAALAGQTASGPQVIAFVKARLLGTLSNPAAAVLAVVIALLIVVLFYLLLVGWFTRIAVLLVLAGIAPVALACYSLPQLAAVAGLWWRLLLGCLATPVLQAAFFTTAVDLLLSPTHNVPLLLSLPAGANTDVVNLFIAAAVLWLTVRIPKLVARYATRAAPPSTAGVLSRAVVVQALTRRLRIF